MIVHETVWLMYQLILIFFDNNDFSFKFSTQFKPLKTFMIIFDSMLNNPKSERIEFVQSAHEYLAKNGFCSANDGEFLLWSMDVLVDYTKNCELCKQSEETDDVHVQTTSENTETSNNDDTEASISVTEINKEQASKEKTKSKSKKSISNPTNGAKNSSYCVTCEG